LISIPSVNPEIENGVGERELASFIADWFRKIRKFDVYEQRVSKNRFNVIAILRGNGHGQSLMLNGHMDTVGTSGMHVNAFGTRIREGVIHGRGSCDMKGSLAAMMTAMLWLANSTRRLDGDILFTAVVDEEYKSLGTSNLVKRFTADAAIVGEPTSLDIGVAHKGYAWVEVETFGKRAHGSVPDRGIDAIEKMSRIISGFNHVRRRHKLRKHPLLGTAKIHTSKIIGGSDWSSVPSRCVLQLERRLLPGETAKDATNEVKEIVRAMAERDDKLKARVRLIYHADAMQVMHPPHLSILKNEAKRSGARARIIGLPYWTDAAILVNEAKIPTCLFGAGDIAVAHGPDEYVRIDEVIKAAGIYGQTAQRYCNGFHAS
jgi:acetylornithine deacetylase